MDSNGEVVITPTASAGTRGDGTKADDLRQLASVNGWEKESENGQTVIQRGSDTLTPANNEQAAIIENMVKGEAFTICTINVDGMPKEILSIDVNTEGPGEEYSPAVAKFLLNKEFDMIFTQENFNYHAQLAAPFDEAGYLHDIGNLVNRSEHSQSGAIMAFRILDHLGFPPDEIGQIVTAIGNHDEGTGVPVSALAAALILADKSDVRRSRVRNQDISAFDIHDRVNYSVTKAELKINEAHTLIKLKLTVDTHFSSVMDYFEIFLNRMILCRKAAEKLGLQFKLMINEQQLM